MINKRFDQVEKADIDALISDEEPENRNLDYKQELPGGTDNDKKEFLADVSSFANASGGYILYGIPEKRDGDGKPTGIPERADGLSINADLEIKRMDSLIRDGIEPRIIGYHIREITEFSKGPVILVYIPKSWMPPHMVTIKGSSRFYSRTSKGKYPLDITEIRSAVLLSESIADKIRQFRDGRLTRIIAAETPVPLDQEAKIVMHIHPISGLDLTKQIDIRSINPGDLKPLAPFSGWNHRINFDGFLTFVCQKDRPCGCYLQLFRNGAIETVNSSMLQDDGRGKLF
ncbi:MAG: ATP-binding protein [Methanothrix sp.]|nr:ATP-binding protein [Methanothrix sp.]